MCILVTSITLFVQNVLFFSTTLPEKMWSVKVYVVVVVVGGGLLCFRDERISLANNNKKNFFRPRDKSLSPVPTTVHGTPGIKLMNVTNVPHPHPHTPGLGRLANTTLGPFVS